MCNTCPKIVTFVFLDIFNILVVIFSLFCTHTKLYEAGIAGATSSQICYHITLQNYYKL